MSIEIHSANAPEPAFGSVLLAHGLTGTAFQRFFSDGLYHGTNGKVLTFEELVTASLGTGGTGHPVLLIHDAGPHDHTDDSGVPIYVDGAIPESERGDQ